jgi:branched-chain amino acid aminotransferase
MKPSLIIFLDGQKIHASPSMRDSFAPGVLKARGVFETLRVYRGKTFALKEHLARLRCGVRALHLNYDVSFKKISQKIDALVRENRIKEGRLRISIWKEGNTTREALILQSVEDDARLHKEGGFKASVSNLRFPSVRNSKIKSLDYGLFRQAFVNAKRDGYDEAILVNRKGFVVEGSRSNVFMVQDRCLWTPPSTTGCLEGITRQFVIQIAKRFKRPVRYKFFTATELSQADEAFLTNSLLEIMPLVQLNKNHIASGKPGMITRQIHQAYRGLLKAYI